MVFTTAAATALTLRQEINLFIFCENLQGTAASLRAQSSKTDILFSFSSRSIFEFHVMSFITCFDDDIWHTAVVENGTIGKKVD